MQTICIQSLEDDLLGYTTNREKGYKVKYAYAPILTSTQLFFKGLPNFLLCTL